MNKDRKHEKDSRRKRIKDMIHSLSLNDKSSTQEDRLTDIYHEAVKRFMKKGDDEETAKQKAVEALSLFLQQGMGIKRNDDDRIELVILKEAKNGR